MGSDRARETYNEKRQYLRVVRQQGKVVLEADANEAQQIATEEMRRQLIDLIGPHGVPRDPISGNRGTGYRIHKLLPKTYDFHIDAGSLYAGGWNVQQHDAALTYRKQPEWLDHPQLHSHGGDPSADPHKEIAYLRLREQEISAVEDTSLLEPALGGPDTAQRVRLVRRVGRAEMERPSLTGVDWGSPGIALGADQTTLCRTAKLSVGFDPLAGAYLGPENQMIRVQGAVRASANPASANPASAHSSVATQLVWAYDNASSLYRAEFPDPTDLTTLKLLTTPVDAWHQPKSNQFAEVLLVAADLDPDACIAATTGQLRQITQAYDPTTQTLGLAVALPGKYASAERLFVRIWENTLDVESASDTGAVLVDSNGNSTGLQIMLQDETNQTVAVVPGDYWSFAVRPAVPTNIFPARYLEPQPPDGPREWACALAVIDWTSERIIDCRPSFTNLTRLSAHDGCCTLTLDQEDLKDRSLEEWIESVDRGDHPLTICLRPGRYQLERPICLNRDHSRITIEACGGCVEFMAAGPEPDRFRQGLLQFHETRDVKLRGVRLVLPEATFIEVVTAELAEFVPGALAEEYAIFMELRSMQLSIGLQLAGCTGLTVEDCTFSLPDHEGERGGRVFGASIFATGEVFGLQIHNCVFRGDDRPSGDQRHLLFGVVHTPPARDEREMLGWAKENRHEDVLRYHAREGHATYLEDASFCGNTFDGLTAAALVLAHQGRVRIADNGVRDCYGGFWHFALHGDRFEWEGLGDYDAILSHVVADPHVYWPLTLARCLHHPSTFQDPERRHANLDLHVHNNSIDVSSTAVIGWHASGSEGGSAILNANRLTSRMRAMPTGIIANTHYSSVTGNVLCNHAAAAEKEATAFVISRGSTPCSFAECGNVHEGNLRLPRPVEEQHPPAGAKARRRPGG